MEYNKIVEEFKKSNRFIAQAIIDGKEEIVHVKTQEERELLVPNAKVIGRLLHNLNRNKIFINSRMER